MTVAIVLVTEAIIGAAEPIFLVTLTIEFATEAIISIRKAFFFTIEAFLFRTEAICVGDTIGFGAANR